MRYVVHFEISVHHNFSLLLFMHEKYGGKKKKKLSTFFMHEKVTVEKTIYHSDLE